MDSKSYITSYMVSPTKPSIGRNASAAGRNFLQVSTGPIWFLGQMNEPKALTDAKALILASILIAEAPAPERAAKLGLYGWLAGSWTTDIVTYGPDGSRHEGKGEIHAGWVLEGRAIQDVWMIPPRQQRQPDSPILAVSGNWYGTTLRVYDPTLDAWRIYWIDPATNSFRQQIGRQRGRDIVQEGRTEGGALSRWSFTDIAPDSFRWLGESSTDDGVSWQLVVEVMARRAA